MRPLWPLCWRVHGSTEYSCCAAADLPRGTAVGCLQVVWQWGPSLIARWKEVLVRADVDAIGRGRSMGVAPVPSACSTSSSATRDCQHQQQQKGHHRRHRMEQDKGGKVTRMNGRTSCMGQSPPPSTTHNNTTTTALLQCTMQHLFHHSSGTKGRSSASALRVVMSCCGARVRWIMDQERQRFDLKLESTACVKVQTSNKYVCTRLSGWLA